MTLTPKQLERRARKGGAASTANLSPEERKVRAGAAVAARWKRRGSDARRAMTDYVRRRHDFEGSSYRVACTVCQAKPFEWCVTTGGNIRTVTHYERAPARATHGTWRTPLNRGTRFGKNSLGKMVRRAMSLRIRRREDFHGSLYREPCALCLADPFEWCITTGGHIRDGAHAGRGRKQ